MVILEIEHQVPNFEGWKKAFENDPVNRKKAGVTGYKILQRTNDPNYVIINLEFDRLKEAEDMCTALQTLWKKVEGKIIHEPKIRILNLIESKNL